MNTKRASKLRKEVYVDLSIKNRKYYMNRKTGAVIADQERQTYQGLKKAWNRLSRIEKKRMAENEKRSNRTITS